MAQKVAAILLSAGFSSRMGAFKPLLPLWDSPGQTSVLERNIALFRSAGIEDIRVVIGHRAEDLLPLLDRLRIQPVFNPRYRSGMFSSVVAGVASLGRLQDAFFLLPVDIPLVRRQTLIDIMSIGESPERRVVYPTFRGKRGHPPLISVGFRVDIEAWSGEGGLKGLLEQYEIAAVEIEVADEGILCDMDTPSDYRYLLERSARIHSPTPEECRVLLENVLHVAHDIRCHGEIVSRLAALLGSELNRVGCSMDIELLTAAGLLHDLARKEPDHARCAAQLLRDRGFGAVSDLVACHMNLNVVEGAPVNPAEVLYLADKLVQGERIVSLKERFNSTLERHVHEPAIMEKIALRLKTAQTVQTRLESALGQSLSEVLKSL